MTLRREAPCERMNWRSASTETPRRMTPWTVGKRGSFHPSTCLFSTNQVSFRLLSSVCTKFSRE